MLYYALLFFVIAIIAGLLGFKDVESGANKIARFFFFHFYNPSISRCCCNHFWY